MYAKSQRVLAGYVGSRAVYIVSTDGFLTCKLETCSVSTDELSDIKKCYINFDKNVNDGRILVLCRDNTGYRVYSRRFGRITVLKSTEDLIMASKLGLCNAKLVHRGKQIFISMNRGNIIDLRTYRNGGIANVKEMESMDRGGETGVYTEGIGQRVTGRAVEGLRVRGTEGLQENREGGPEDSGVVRAVCGLKYRSNVKSEHFQKMIDEAKKSNYKGDCVDKHSIKEYDQMNCILFDGGLAGVAVENNGNITSVFKSQNSNVKGFIKYGIQCAVQNGGDRLDCYAIGESGGLAEMYCQCGFIPVCKIKFNREFAPDGWGYDENGEPDIVFMAHLNKNKDDIVGKYGKHKRYEEYTDEDVPYICGTENDYEAAVDFRDKYIEKIKKSEMDRRIESVKNSKGVIETFKNMYRMFDK